MAFQDFMKQLNINNNPLGPDHLVNILDMTVPVGKFSIRNKERFSEVSISNVINPITLSVEHLRCGGDSETSDSFKISAEIYLAVSRANSEAYLDYDAIFHYEEKSAVTEAFRLSGLSGNPSLQILTEYSGSEATHYMLFQYKDLESKTQPFWVNINNI